MGGESLVIRRKHGKGLKAFKIIPLDGEKDETKNIIQKLQNRISGNIDESEKGSKAPPSVSNPSEVNRSLHQISKRPKMTKPQNQSSLDFNTKIIVISSDDDLEITEIPSDAGRSGEESFSKTENLEENIEMVKISNNPQLLSGRGEYECSAIVHPNIIRYENVTLDVVNNDVCLIVLMDIYSCNLWQYLKNFHLQNRNITMAVRFKLFEKIFSGAKEIQDHGFKHLDLKPGNVLLITRPDGTWNEDDCVITDFGVGGLHDQETGLAGTPGFASPEQLIGPSHRKSDNFSFGKLMVMVFCNWPTSWNLLFRPITENERNQIRFNQRFMHVVRELLKVKKSQNIFLYFSKLLF